MITNINQILFHWTSKKSFKDVDEQMLVDLTNQYPECFGTHLLLNYYLSTQFLPLNTGNYIDLFIKDPLKVSYLLSISSQTNGFHNNSISEMISDIESVEVSNEEFNSEVQKKFENTNFEFTKIQPSEITAIAEIITTENTAKEVISTEISATEETNTTEITSTEEVITTEISATAEVRTAEIPVAEKISESEIVEKKEENNFSVKFENSRDVIVETNSTQIKPPPKQFNFPINKEVQQDYFKTQGIVVTNEFPQIKLDIQNQSKKTFLNWLKNYAIKEEKLNSTTQQNTGTKKETDKTEKSEKEKRSSKTEKTEQPLMIYTETMAEIFVFQGRSDSAIEIYTKLKTDFPEKEAYFNEKINSLNLNK